MISARVQEGWILKKSPHNLLKIAVGFWLAGWFWKAKFLFPYLLGTSVDYPIVFSFFPTFFTDSGVSGAFYLLPLLVVPIFLFNLERYFVLSACVLVICAGVLTLHINTCNAATFVSSFWAALWISWFARHVNDETESLAPMARRLAQGVMTVIFLGAVIGKLTPEYWSGEVFTKAIFGQGGAVFVGYAMTWFSPEIQPVVLAVLAKISIIAELVLACSFFLPYRIFLGCVLFVFLGIVLFSSVGILSVLLPLLGIVWAAKNLPEKRL